MEAQSEGARSFRELLRYVLQVIARSSLDTTDVSTPNRIELKN